ncbi:transmembrane protein 272-like [Boleophthalmus pectinirostris]|uniref:transmembrane protein 272-like n=1 Tax=Boleophthalmus pectinirostris TaxID=150288 RepID=UPI0024332E86|nr:transmembrane protein 272-like [Boleophthalmus pectinirostris]
MDSPPEDAPRPQSTVIISSIAVVNFLWWMVLLAAIGFGAIHVKSCPAQPYIPIYMIVLGSVSLISLTLTYTKSIWVDGPVFMVASTCISLLYLFDFCWFIAGSVWVYSIYPPDYSNESPHFCFKPFYIFAFVITTLVWATSGLLCICGGCFFACSCCTAVEAGRNLLPARVSFYGTTASSDYKPIVGDV